MVWHDKGLQSYTHSYVDMNTDQCDFFFQDGLYEIVLKFEKFFGVTKCKVTGIIKIIQNKEGKLTK